MRASVVDAFSYNFHVSVPSDAVYDRSPVVHEVSLFDMAQKYADVTTTNALVNRLRELRTVQAPAEPSPAEGDSSAPQFKRKEIPWKG